MAEETKIEWATSSWNPWIGCTKVSPGCARCYAETLDRNRFSKSLGGGSKAKPISHWGKGAPRHRTSVSKWKEPVKWDRDASVNETERDGFGYEPAQRPRIFPSLCDWLDEEVPIEWLADFLRLIHETPNLDWLLLTKRPENWRDRIAKAQAHADRWKSETVNWLWRWFQEGEAPANVWIGTSVENQEYADKRIPDLLKIPAKVRFLSVEPMLGPVDLSGWGDERCTWDKAAQPDKWEEFKWPDWVPAEDRKQIAGFWSESNGRSPKSWVEDMICQHAPNTGAVVGLDKSNWVCKVEDPKAVAQGVFIHRWNNIGTVVVGDERRGCAFSSGPGWLSKWLQKDGTYQHRLHWVIFGGESGKGARPCNVEWIRNGVKQCQAAGVKVFVKQLGKLVHFGAQEGTAEYYNPGNWLALKHPKGGDPLEWPEELRVREFPDVG